MTDLEARAHEAWERADWDSNRLAVMVAEAEVEIARLRGDLAAARRDRDEAQMEYADLLGSLAGTHQQLDLAEAEVDRLRSDVQYWTDVAATQHQALAFYADPANWVWSYTSATTTGDGAAFRDLGARAWAALAGRTEEPRPMSDLAAIRRRDAHGYEGYAGPASRAQQLREDVATLLAALAAAQPVLEAARRWRRGMNPGDWIALTEALDAHDAVLAGRTEEKP